MSFLTIVIALWLAIKWRATNSPIRFQWFSDYGHFVIQCLDKIGCRVNWIRLLVWIMLPVLCVAWIGGAWENAGMQWMYGVWGLFILWLAMVTPVPENGAVECAVLGSLHSGHIETRLVFLRVYYRYCAPMFWFLLLGPAAAFAYRLCHLAMTLNIVKDGKILMACLRLMDWLSMRIVGFSYTLVGDFVKGFSVWREGVLNLKTECQILLIKTGVASLNLAESASGDEYHSEATQLVKRALILLLFVLSILTLMGLI